MAAGNRTGRIDYLAYGFIAIPVMAIVVFLFYPAALAIVGTLFHKRPDGGVGFDASSYIFFFTDPYSLANLMRTLWTTFVALALIIAVNLPIALYMRFKRGWLASLIQGLALFPMFVPGIIICYALILISGLATISDASIEAARDVGAGRLRILRSIILPQITHSMLIVSALNFLGFFGQVLMPFMLGPTNPEMMGPFMLRTFVSVRDPLQAATQATITFLICSLAGLAYVRSLAARKEER